MGNTWEQTGITRSFEPFDGKSSITGHRSLNRLFTAFFACLTAPTLVLADLCAFIPGIITIIKEYK
jgi:hypothetical protein